VSIKSCSAKLKVPSRATYLFVLKNSNAVLVANTIEICGYVRRCRKNVPWYLFCNSAMTSPVCKREYQSIENSKDFTCIFGMRQRVFPRINLRHVGDVLWLGCICHSLSIDLTRFRTSLELVNRSLFCCNVRRGFGGRGMVVHIFKHDVQVWDVRVPLLSQTPSCLLGSTIVVCPGVCGLFLLNLSFFQRFCDKCV
jgi:hypothetical protein